MNIIPFVDLKAQHAALRPGLDAAFARLMDNCNFVLGSPVAEFEQAFALFTGVKHAIGVGNGLEALRLTLQASGIGPGDEVVVPVNTFIATAFAVSQTGARPHFVDCDRETFNINPAKIERALTPHTKAIIPVHLTGQAADMDAILEIAHSRGLRVIEDAAQAAGVLYKGRPCGSIGEAAAFSFYPGKNLGACGDGGAITTNDGDLAARLCRIRNCGQSAKYVHVDQGSNSRLDTIQAAILLLKLGHLHEWNAARNRHAQIYRQLLSGVGDLIFQEQTAYSTHIYHLFIIQTARREALQKHLREKSIETNIHYPVPIHLQNAYASHGHKKGDFPVAESLAERVLSLPMYPELTSIQIERIADSVRNFFLK